MIKEITKGSVKRKEKEKENKINQQIKRQENKNKKIDKSVENQVLGIYKKNVIDSFITTFASNYGEDFDYDSLLNSLSFSIKNDSHGLHPDFKFNVNNVKFNSDMNKECRRFNENSYDDFISNDEVVDGRQLDYVQFNNSEERESYENISKDISSKVSDTMDGQFIPTTDNKDRFGEFNKINKLLGYTPKEESGKIAERESKKN